jgi:predicted metal-dependent hydrolase
MYPKEYIHFLVHFHGDRDYFECHEILEEYWKKINRSNKDSIWVAFILLAVSCYHHRRENFPGAAKTLEKSLAIFMLNKKGIPDLGLETNSFFTLLENQQIKITNKLPFYPVDLPILDTTLEQNCRQLCVSLGMEWKSLNQVSEEIIHRHLTRDRSIVLEEREAAVKRRRHGGK